tara:strand:- start:712 stop:1014 length:303 start_codon:yes stop_codon:yes gene_type:complete
MAIRTEQDALLDGVKKNTMTALSPRAADLIVGTDESVGPYFAITALEDAVVDVSECDMSFLGGVAANSGTNNFTIPKGLTIYGNFASIELASGKVIAYKL